ALLSVVMPGIRVLVPFGRQAPVAGFVVSIRNDCPDLTSGRATPIQIKPILEVLDEEPLFGREYIDFLYWTAEYYLCTISEVISAAVPAEIGPRVKRYIRLCDAVVPPGMLALPAHLLESLTP